MASLLILSALTVFSSAQESPRELYLRLFSRQDGRQGAVAFFEAARLASPEERTRLNRLIENSRILRSLANSGRSFAAQLDPRLTTGDSGVDDRLNFPREWILHLIDAWGPTRPLPEEKKLPDAVVRQRATASVLQYFGQLPTGTVLEFLEQSRRGEVPFYPDEIGREFQRRVNYHELMTELGSVQSRHFGDLQAFLLKRIASLRKANLAWGLRTQGFKADQRIGVGNRSVLFHEILADLEPALTSAKKPEFNVRPSYTVTERAVSFAKLASKFLLWDGHFQRSLTFSSREFGARRLPDSDAWLYQNQPANIGDLLRRAASSGYGLESVLGNVATSRDYALLQLARVIRDSVSVVNLRLQLQALPLEPLLGRILSRSSVYVDSVQALECFGYLSGRSWWAELDRRPRKRGWVGQTWDTLERFTERRNPLRFVGGLLLASAITLANVANEVGPFSIDRLSESQWRIPILDVKVGELVGGTRDSVDSFFQWLGDSLRWNEDSRSSGGLFDDEIRPPTNDGKGKEEKEVIFFRVAGIPVPHEPLVFDLPTKKQVIGARKWQSPRRDEAQSRQISIVSITPQMADAQGQVALPRLFGTVLAGGDAGAGKVQVEKGGHLISSTGHEPGAMVSAELSFWLSESPESSGNLPVLSVPDMGLLSSILRSAGFSVASGILFEQVIRQNTLSIPDLAELLASTSVYSSVPERKDPLASARGPLAPMSRFLIGGRLHGECDAGAETLYILLRAVLPDDYEVDRIRGFSLEPMSLTLGQNRLHRRVRIRKGVETWILDATPRITQQPGRPGPEPERRLGPACREKEGCIDVADVQAEPTVEPRTLIESHPLFSSGFDKWEILSQLQALFESPAVREAQRVLGPEGFARTALGRMYRFSYLAVLRGKTQIGDTAFRSQLKSIYPKISAEAAKSLEHALTEINAWEARAWIRLREIAARNPEATKVRWYLRNEDLPHIFQDLLELLRTAVPNFTAARDRCSEQLESMTASEEQ